MALDTGGNSMTERAVSQMAERGSNVSDAEKEYYGSLSVEQAVLYEPTEILTRTVISERVNSGASAESETHDKMVDVVREGIKKINDPATRVPTLPSRELELVPQSTSEIITTSQTFERELLKGGAPELLEGVIATQRGFLQAADENTQTFGFKLAQGLAWTRGVYTALRGFMLGAAARKAAEITSHHTEGQIGNGFVSKLSIAGLTVGGGMLASFLAGDWVPTLSSIGAGVTVQRGTYRAITASALRRPDKGRISLVPEWALNHWRHTWKGDAKRGEKTGFWRIPQRFLSPIHTASQSMEDRMINADDIYRLGIAARDDEKNNIVDSEAMHQVEQYVATLGNRIDERRAAGDQIGKNDPEYNTLVAALQVMSLSSVKETPNDSLLAGGERTTGIRTAFQDVRTTRLAALAGSVGAGVATFFTVGALFNVWNTYKESLAARAELQRAKDVRLQKEAAAAATMAQAQKELMNVEIDPDHITKTAEKVFGITKESSVDTNFTEHLVRLDMAKTLGAKLDANGALTAEDYTTLAGYGVRPTDGWQLDFTHMTDTGKGLVTTHINSLESLAAGAKAAVSPSVIESLSGMQTAHLDHETMMMLSRNLNMKIEDLRTLRWNPSSSEAVHKLFEDQGRVIAALLNNKEVLIDGKLVRLSDIPGANDLEKMRHVLKGWAESRKGIDLASVVPGGANKNVPDSKGGKPAPHPGATKGQSTSAPKAGAPVVTPVEQVGTVNPGAPVALVDRVLPTLQVDPAPTLEAPVTSTGNSGVEATAANSVPTTHGVNGIDAVTVSNDPLQKARDAVDALNGPEVTSNPVQTLKPPVKVEEIVSKSTQGGVHEFAPPQAVKEVAKEVKRRTVEGPSVDVVDVSDLKRVEIPKPSEKTD